MTLGFLENLWTLSSVLYLGRICVYLQVTGSEVFLVPNTVQTVETKDHKAQYQYGLL
jgi:hypothetical protein